MSNLLNSTALPPKIDLLDPEWTLKGPEDQMYFEYTQDVDDSFLGSLSDQRIASANSRAKDLHLAADIPVAVVDKWKREGFDIFKESWKSIRKRLVAENLGAFITTSKAL